MYAWIWGHIPGNSWVRVMIAVSLVLAVVAVLFLWIFPIVDAMVTFDDSEISSSEAVGARVP